MNIPKLFFCALFLTGIMLGCKSDNQQQTTARHAITDTLIVGIMPTLDCVPIYMARTYNIYDSLGLYVRLTCMNSQMDLENLLANGKIDIAPSDMFRTIMWQNKRKNIRFLASSCREWRLYANKKRRISKVGHLGNRMIGMTRQSVLDYYCDTINSKLMRNSELLLKPQINDVFIRLQMLNEAQLDAIFLPLPLDQLAEEKGHNKISDLKGCDGYAGLAVSCNRIKPNRKAVELFLRAYNMAVDSMKIYAEQPLPKYITTHFNIDSIPLKVIKSKSLSHLYHPETKKIASALLWARKNNFATKAYNTDTLTYK